MSDDVSIEASTMGLSYVSPSFLIRAPSVKQPSPTLGPLWASLCHLRVLGSSGPRINASLVIDPGAVIKLEAARIEATFGANIMAEGTDGLPIVFTSKLDDRVGAGGTFDTNNNGTANAPSPRDWGGIYMAPTSSLSVDYARFSYGGGVTKLDGTFRAFNTIELQQAQGRIAHSVFENNADGFGGQGPGTRFGRLSNEQATIFVRGTQPTIINNDFRNNSGNAITIDANSMVDDCDARFGSTDRFGRYQSQLCRQSWSTHSRQSNDWQRPERT